MLCKVKKPTEIYMKIEDKLVYLGTTPSIRNRESFVLDNEEKVIAMYKIHNVFKGWGNLEVASNKSLKQDIYSNKILIARNYIWNIELGEISGYRYTILKHSNVMKTANDKIKIESKLINREDKYIYL